MLLSALVFGGSQPVAMINARPSWSPDGKGIAYTSNREGTFGIWKTDGVHVRRVVRDGHDPAWSPDGRLIAYTARGGGIALVPAAGGTPRLLTANGDGYEASWSPDGRRLAYVRAGGDGDGYAIMIMRSNGSGKEQVSGSSEFDAHYAPAWSPTGRSIAYVYSHFSGLVELERTFLPTNRFDAFTQTAGVAGRPSWSPDARSIVFADDHAPGPELSGEPDGYGSLYVVDASTKHLRRLARVRANGAAWSPGGKRIAFASPTPEGSTDIYLINRDGTHLVRLTKR